MAFCRRIGRGDVEPMVGFAVQLGALGAGVRASAPAAHAAVECDAPVEAGVMSTGVWQ